MTSPLSNRLLFFILAILFVSGSIFFFHDFKARVEPKKSTEPKFVRTKYPVSLEGKALRSFSGIIREAESGTVSAKVSGYALRLLKEPGETVSKGEVIALVDAESSAVLADTASRISALSRTIAADTREYYDRKQKEAEAFLKKTKENRDQGNATSKDVAIAENSLSSLKKLRDIEESRAKIGSAEANGSLQGARIQQGNAVIRSPFSGLVTSRFVSTGEFVAPGSPLYQLALSEARELEVSVPGTFSKSLSLGQKVVITKRISPDSVIESTGIVRALDSSKMAGTGEVKVSVRLREKADDPFSVIPIGETASLTIPEDQRSLSEKTQDDMRLLIPDTALFTEYDASFVFVLVDGKVVRRLVSVGKRFGDDREIFSGISKEDAVITEGVRGLRDGTHAQTYEN